MEKVLDLLELAKLKGGNGDLTTEAVPAYCEESEIIVCNESDSPSDTIPTAL